MGDLTKNFSAWEFECRCKCGTGAMSFEFLEQLQKMRDDYGDTITIRSGIRCPEHNAKVGGKPDSEHLPDPVTGLTEGADIAFDGSSRQRRSFIIHSHKHFKRVGIASNFFHLGTRKTKAQEVTFIYPPKKKKGTP